MVAVFGLVGGLGKCVCMSVVETRPAGHDWSGGGGGGQYGEGVCMSVVETRPVIQAPGKQGGNAAQGVLVSARVM